MARPGAVFIRRLFGVNFACVVRLHYLCYQGEDRLHLGRAEASFVLLPGVHCLGYINNILMNAMYETDVLAAWVKGTDAGLYRLIPQRVATATDEQAVRALLAEAAATGQSLTFRAAGTSLAGQAATGSVLVKIGEGFGEPRIEAKGLYATFPCHLTGAEANRLLEPYRRRLGPRPGSIRAARIGGIVADNASGAGQGILHNPYHTIRSLRVILADGTLLDTGSDVSRRIFFETHTSLLEKLMNLRMEVLCDEEMTGCILHAYELKNALGYGLNALLDFEDPYDILVHLMVGSEGTLGFISQATFETVPDSTYKAAAWVCFPTMEEACRAVAPLRACGVAAAEWIDGRALRAVAASGEMPGWLAPLPEEAVVLLVEVATSDETLLRQKVDALEKYISALPVLYPPSFTTDPALYAQYWQMRDHVYPSIAARRPAETMSMVADIAFRPEVLADAVAAVRRLLAEWGYVDAGVWGHLLEGNVHFALFPAFRRPGEEERYVGFRERLADLVGQYDGSVQAGQGTGRQMAPFVEKKWGPKIYQLMKEIKRLFDPGNILNAGVILADDAAGSIGQFKQMPSTGEAVDRCIECGFCEVAGGVRRPVLTPRQRIVAYRMLRSMQAARQTDSPRYRALEKALRAAGKTDCATVEGEAADCPLGIDTGPLINQLCRQQPSGAASRLIALAAERFPGITTCLSSLRLAWGGKGIGR